ncbi:Protein of unknown function [Pyronema omphalodes CBS 100304]|uniref:Uncharacterized protein n=1 Tax=Pyronema omphalodes (strain CBS 100304) TaxID=1076935 RepID=U4LKY8_PYROM|nr:Protein of unknown function [Pyronema omphalodes CBS 100304]
MSSIFCLRKGLRLIQKIMMTEHRCFMLPNGGKKQSSVFCLRKERKLTGKIRTERQRCSMQLNMGTKIPSVLGIVQNRSARLLWECQRVKYMLTQHGAVL